VLGILAFFAVFLLMRYYEFDLPAWHYVFGYRPDPLSLHLNGEFVESNLGLAQEADGSLTVRLVAEQFLFVPQCIQVPVGVPIRFRVTSADVVHLLFFAGTTDKIRASPGYITESRLSFPHPGTFSIPCHEFCGAGHYAMRSRVVALPKEELHPPRAGERSACAPE
jgi:cytochrome c oxidase subunit 2